MNDDKRNILATPEGPERPNDRTKLGRALRAYTAKNGPAYDHEFDRKIREKFPHWFADKSSQKKEALLGMPEGSARPKLRTKLGVALNCYIGKSKSSSYDPVFDKKIRERHPNWFISKSDQKKKELLDMPKGAKRPKRKSK